MLSPQSKKFAAVAAVVMVIGVLFFVSSRHGSKKLADGKDVAPGTAQSVSHGAAGDLNSGNPTSGNNVQASTPHPESAAAPKTGGIAVPEKSTGVAVAEPVAAPKKTGPECYTQNFRHKVISSHNSGEVCSTHRNLVKVDHLGVNVKSLCVRVNGTPTRYQAVEKKDKTVAAVIVGPIAGPQSVITVRYCLGKSQCPEDCTIPKDEFMDAIGGDEGESLKPIQIVKWDPTDTDKAVDVAAEVDAQLKKELGNSSDLSLFEDWVASNESPVCGVKSAQLETPQVRK